MAHYWIYRVYERAVDIFLKDWSMKMPQKDIENMQFNCRRLMGEKKTNDISGVFFECTQLILGLKSKKIKK